LLGSRDGDTVLDPFSGSGTTGLAAGELGRRAILIELNPAYAEGVRRRTADYQPQLHMSVASKAEGESKSRVKKARIKAINT
jgi:DNA modification methylase